MLGIFREVRRGLNVTRRVRRIEHRPSRFRYGASPDCNPESLGALRESSYGRLPHNPLRWRRRARARCANVEGLVEVRLVSGLFP